MDNEMNRTIIENFEVTSIDSGEQEQLSKLNTHSVLRDGNGSLHFITVPTRDAEFIEHSLLNSEYITTHIANGFIIDLINTPSDPGESQIQHSSPSQVQIPQGQLHVPSQSQTQGVGNSSPQQFVTPVSVTSTAESIPGNNLIFHGNPDNDSNRKITATLMHLVNKQYVGNEHIVNSNNGGDITNTRIGNETQVIVSRTSSKDFSTFAHLSGGDNVKQNSSINQNLLPRNSSSSSSSSAARQAQPILNNNENQLRIYSTTSSIQNQFNINPPPLPPLTPIRRLNSPRRNSNHIIQNITKSEFNKSSNDIILVGSKASSNNEDVIMKENEAKSRPMAKKNLPHKKRITKKLKAINKLQHDLSYNIIDEEIEDAGEEENVLTVSQFSCQLCGAVVESQLEFFAHLKQHYEPADIKEEITLEQDKIKDTTVIDEDLKEVDLNFGTFRNDCINNGNKLITSDNKSLSFHQPSTLPLDTATTAISPSSSLCASLSSMASSSSQLSGVFHSSTTHATKNVATAASTVVTAPVASILESSIITVPTPQVQVSNFPVNATLEASSSAATVDLNAGEIEFSDTEDMLEGIRGVVDKVQQSVDNDTNDGMDLITEKAWFTNSALNGGIHFKTNQNQTLQQNVDNFSILFKNDFDGNNQMKNELENNEIKDELSNSDLKPEFNDNQESLPAPLSISSNNNQSEEYTQNKDDTDRETADEMNKDSEETPKKQKPIKELNEITRTCKRIGLRVDNKWKLQQDEDLRMSSEILKNAVQCPKCDKVFNSLNALKYHDLSHTGKRPHQCEICGKGFFALSAVKVHMRLHSGDKPYTCEYCKRPFRQFGDLKYHVISIHTNERNFICEYCGKAFARRYSLVVHRRIHTSEKNYKCEFCSKSFRASSYLQSHRKTHTGERPYECKICGKKFRINGDLKRHTKIHERIKILGKDTVITSKTKSRNNSTELEQNTNNNNNNPENKKHASNNKIKITGNHQIYIQEESIHLFKNEPSSPDIQSSNASLSSTCIGDNFVPSAGERGKLISNQSEISQDNNKNHKRSIEIITDKCNVKKNEKVTNFTYSFW